MSLAGLGAFAPRFVRRMVYCLLDAELASDPGRIRWFCSPTCRDIGNTDPAHALLAEAEISAIPAWVECAYCMQPLDGAARVIVTHAEQPSQTVQQAPVPTRAIRLRDTEDDHD